MPRLSLLRIARQHNALSSVGMAVVSLVVLAVVLELCFGVLNNRKHVVILQQWAGLNCPDPILGYRARPNGRLEDRGYRNGDLIYSAVYTTNASGRRCTPLPPAGARHKFLALFGCSFTYGLCVNDDQTLGACIARRAPDYEPYNFGYQGYGTQHVMLTLEEPLEKEIRQADGIGIYLFDAAHINRAIGAMSCVARWGGDLPSYRLDGETLVREGTFGTAHPWRQHIFSLLYKSQVRSYFDINLPLWPRDRDFHLVARMIDRSSRLFHDKWPGSEFYVVFRPTPPTMQTAESLGRYLDRYGVKYIRCPDIYAGRLDPAAQAVEGLRGHPSPAANEVFAEFLVRHLELG